MNSKVKHSNSQVNDVYSEYVNQQENQDQHLNFEAVLDTIGFGYYQICVFIVVGVIGMCDAGESQALSLVLPILEKQWGISSFQESLLGSLVYTGDRQLISVGYLIGSLLSGFLGDNYGRKPCIFYSSGFMLVTSIAGAFMPDYISYTIFRILLVTCVGFIIPIAYSLLAETTPLKYRGFVLVFIGLFYSMGELTVCILAYVFMPTLQEGNWRAVLVWSSVPAALVFIISYFILLESPRYLLVKQQSELAKKIILKMGEINKSNISELNAIPLQDFISLSHQLIDNSSQQLGDDIDSQTSKQPEAQLGNLFQSQFRTITPIIWYQWMVSSFVFSGITFLLPLTLKILHPKDNDDDDNSGTDIIKIDLNVITFSVLGELPTIFVAAIIVNIKFLGRKNSLAIAYFLCGILGLIIFFFSQEDERLFTFLVSGSKLSINLAFTINYEFTAEIYPTYMRASGIGLASCVGKIGSIVMPWVVIYMSPIGTFTPYLIFGAFSLIGGVLTLFLPFDTYNRELDKPCH